MRTDIAESDIREVYNEDTKGRKYHVPIVSRRQVMMGGGSAGEVLSANLNKPMKREEFKKLSDSSKRVYIQGMRTEYGCSAKQMADMLGYSPAYFSTMASSLGLHGLFKGSRPSKKQTAKWKRFVNGPNTGDVITEKTPVVMSATPIKTDIVVDAKPQKTQLLGCEFALEGELSADDIANTIRVMLSEGMRYRVSVKIDTLTGEPDACTHECKCGRQDASA